MAAKIAIAMRTQAATKRLNQVMTALYGEGFVLPTRGKDAGLLHAQQLEAIAEFLEAQSQPAPYVIGVDWAAGEDRAVVAAPKRKAKRNANAHG